MSERDQKSNMRALGMEAGYLAACALEDQVPNVPESLDLQALYRFCKFHSIASIVAMALEKVWAEHPAEDDVMHQWRQARDKVIRKNVLLNAERQRILNHLESIGCWYMPLKGSLLQFDYPRFGMRQMSDNDLLCDPDKRSDIRDFMLGSGYTCEQFNHGHHDEYNRKPVYNFEIHKSLFRPEEAPVAAAYYADIHERSEKDPENKFGYHLNPSDFYIYITIHAWNHFRESGIGIRWLLDVFVFLKKHAAELDRAYVSGELDKLGALEFSRWSERLSEKLLGVPGLDKEFSPEEEQLLDAFFTSGAFGTQSQLFQKSFEKFREEHGGSRLGYFLRRMFPPRELLGVAYPIVKRHKWLVPFVWIYRLIYTAFTNPGRMLRETKHISTEKQK